MTTDKQLDELLDAYCEGLYAMDPRTTFPFWDYDFAPLISSLWVNDMLDVIRRARRLGPALSRGVQLFSGPSVPRKELIYALFDMKVAHLGFTERMEIVDFWIEILNEMCGTSWLSPQKDLREVYSVPPLDSAGWMTTDVSSGRAIGALISALHALSYGLYSDIFTHQCAECHGPYDVSHAVGLRNGELLLRRWTNLAPFELWHHVEDPGFRDVTIGTIYEGLGANVDIYNHISWVGNAPAAMRHALVLLDGWPLGPSPEGILALAVRVADIAGRQHLRYRSLSFEQQKRLWVRQRRYQFRRLYGVAGAGWECPSMEASTLAMPLHNEPYWNMTLPKGPLFRFLRQCLDPRNDVFYESWRQIFQIEFENGETESLA